MYTSRIGLGSSHGRQRLTRIGDARGATPIWFPGVLTVVLLIVAGITYRFGAARVENPPAIVLPVSLKEIPFDVGGWRGQDLDIPTVTVEYMKANFADDFISRRYSQAIEGIWADAYVVYCSSRPGGILGHQPMKCFPGHGWIHDETVTSEFVSRSGRSIPCLIHRFHKPAPAYRRVVVLNFYVLNGQITLSERDFSGLLGRRLNIAGDPARYVAQLQISSVLEHSARSLACDLVDSVLTILPDRHGQTHWLMPQAHESKSSGAFGQGR